MANDAFETFDAATLDPRARSRLLTGCVLPRPIAWVTSVSPAGVVNAAPFSYFNVACSDPMILSIAVSRRGGMRKDTAANAHATGEFVVNVVDEANLVLADACGRDYPPEVSEVEELGLAVIASESVRPPRLAAARVHFECRLERVVELGTRDGAIASDLLLGEVVRVHIAREILAGGYVDVRALAPVSRLGGPLYARVGEILPLKRS